MPSLMNTASSRMSSSCTTKRCRRVGHQPVDLEPDDVAAAAALERGLVGGDQVLRLLLHLDVAVAQHAEGAVAAREEAREQPRQEHADHRLDADEADRLAPSLCALSSTGSRMKRTSWLGIGISACMVVPSRSRLSSTPTVMPPFWMNGKGCDGIDGDRRQDRQILGDELPVEPFALGGLELLRLDDVRCRHRPSRP